jgi:hypothetical protein
MSAREELLDRQVSTIVDRVCGLKAIARLMFDGINNSADDSTLSSAALLIERECDLIEDMLGDLPMPTPAPAAAPTAGVATLKPRRRAPADAEPEHAQ